MPKSPTSLSTVGNLGNHGNLARTAVTEVTEVTDLGGGKHSFPVGSAPAGAGGGRARPIKCGGPLAVESVVADPRLRTWLEQHVRHLHLVVDPGAATALVQGLAERTVGFDIETAPTIAHPAAGLDPRVSSIRLAQFCDPVGQVVYVIDCYKAGTGWVTHLPAVHLVIHNAAFEVRHLLQLSPERMSFDCTMLAGRVLYGENRALKDLAKEIAGIEMSKDLQTSDWSQEMLTEEQICYAAADAVAALVVWRELDGMLQGKYRKAYNFVKSLVYPVAHQSGIRLDTVAHASLIARWDTEIKEARCELAAAGLDNPSSTKQRQQYLERVLPVELLVDWPTTPTGQLATDSDTLLVAEHVPMARALATHRRLSSTHANFGPKLRELLIEDHLFPNFKIAGAVTGRFACSSPNIQNIPRDGFKRLLLPPLGKVFIGGDLSQIELRAAGQISGEEVINQVFREGRDLHRMMAANITGKPEPAITKEERQMAKAVNFGLLYGAGASALQAYAARAYRVTMDLAKAKEVKAIFHETYPTLTEWQRDIVSETNACQYSESKYVQLTRHYDQDVYTHAMNFPIQSSAWEVLALAILHLDQSMPKSVTISHHVHDELVLAAAPDQVDAAARLLEHAFLHGFSTVFPEAPVHGLVEVSRGDTWAALKSQ